jgi:hypothetical protein
MGLQLSHRLTRRLFSRVRCSMFASGSERRWTLVVCLDLPVSFSAFKSPISRIQDLDLVSRIGYRK